MMLMGRVARYWVPVVALFAVAGGFAVAPPAAAKVPAAVAERLEMDLTPMGAQRSGNADGSIPAWTGGISEPPAHITYKIGDRHPDPFADEAPLLTITASNMAQHVDRLMDTTKAMLENYPDSYKINVYPSHRSCAQPARIYAVNRLNALTGELTNGGDGLKGAIAGTAFPIPSVAQEVIWNHKLKFRNFKVTRQFAAASPTSSGKYTIVTVQDEAILHWSDPSKNDVTELNNISIRYIANTVAPARRAGNVILVHETIDQSVGGRKAWVYSPGTRRVRRAPNIAYDNPGNNSDGLSTTDSFGMFNGAMDRYDWRYVGRAEAYIPSNSYAMAQRSVQYADLLKKQHINMDLPRFELQRTWIIDMDLRPNTRHIYKRRRLWVDPDAWQIVGATIYDGRDNLWRVQEAYPAVAWEVPICGAGGLVVNDLNARRYLILGMTQQEPQVNLFADELDETRYTPDSIRRLSAR